MYHVAGLWLALRTLHVKHTRSREKKKAEYSSRKERKTKRVKWQTKKRQQRSAQIKSQLSFQNHKDIARETHDWIKVLVCDGIEE